MSTESARSPNPVDVHVGARLRLRRRQLGISQAQLAHALGLTFQQIQKYERGTNRVSASKLYEAARHLGEPVAYFFEGLLEYEAPPETAEEQALKLYLETEQARRCARAFLTLRPAVADALVRVAEAITA